MAVIHRHDDKYCLILDQQRFLADTYAGTKDARISLSDHSSQDLTWSYRLFNVENPFRCGQSQQKTKKKHKKRTHEEAFSLDSDPLLSQLNAAADFCRSQLSIVHQQSSTIQEEHNFDKIPFAEIATQCRDQLPAIRQILLKDYFLRASKLGIQPNVLYTHDKPYPSVLDTAVGEQIVLPRQCRFLWSDIKNLSIVVDEGTKYSFIVIDPPWLNKSVRRKRPYAWSDFTEIQSLPVEQLIDRQQSSLICCWSTNCDRVENFIKTELFARWQCIYLTTWYWLKITQSGEPVLDLNSTDKKSYETLILGYVGDETRFSELKKNSKIVCSVPALIHSVKPPLHLMFRDLIGIPRENEDRCLEIYARNLLPNFTSVGNEVLKHQSMDLFETASNS